MKKNQLPVLSHMLFQLDYQKTSKDGTLAKSGRFTL